MDVKKNKQNVHTCICNLIPLTIAETTSFPTHLYSFSWKASWLCSFVALSMFHCACTLSLDPVPEEVRLCPVCQSNHDCHRKGRFLSSFLLPSTNAKFTVYYTQDSCIIHGHTMNINAHECDNTHQTQAESVHSNSIVWLCFSQLRYIMSFCRHINSSLFQNLICTLLCCHGDLRIHSITQNHWQYSLWLTT